MVTSQAQNLCSLDIPLSPWRGSMGKKDGHADMLCDLFQGFLLQRHHILIWIGVAQDSRHQHNINIQRHSSVENDFKPYKTLLEPSKITSRARQPLDKPL